MSERREGTMQRPESEKVEAFLAMFNDTIDITLILTRAFKVGYRQGWRDAMTQEHPPEATK